MPETTGLALGALAGSLGDAYAAKQKREYDEQQKNTDLVNSLVKGGIESGAVNPEEGLTFLFSQTKGGKGKKGQLPPQVQNIVRATMKAGGANGAPGSPMTLGGQARPTTGAAPQGSGVPTFKSPQQLSAEAAAAATEQTTQADQAKYQELVRQAQDLQKQDPTLSFRDALELAKTGKAPSQTPKFTPGTVSGGALPPNSTDIYGQPIDPAKYYRQGTDADGVATFVPTEAPASTATKYQPKSPGEKRGLELSGLTTDQWQVLPALQRQAYTAAGDKQITAERATKASQTAERTAAYLKSASAGQTLSAQRLSQMVDQAPILSALRDQQLLNAELLAAARQNDSAKIVQAATKQAEAIEAKKGFLEKFGESLGLGTEPTRAELEDLLISGATGGADPDAVRQDVKAKTGAGSRVAPPPAKGTPKSFKYDPASDSLVAAP